MFSVATAAVSIYSNKNQSDLIQTVAGICFILVSFLFLFSGWKINIRIKKYFNDFYKENRRVLWVATVGLFAPIFLRGSIDLVRQIDDDFDKFVRRNSMYVSPM